MDGGGFAHHVHHEEQLWRAGQVQELRPGALARADSLFAWDPAPWCPFVF